MYLIYDIYVANDLLDITYSECGNNINVVEMLKNELLTFALQRNLYVQVKVINSKF